MFTRFDKTVRCRVAAAMALGGFLFPAFAVADTSPTSTAAALADDQAAIDQQVKEKEQRLQQLDASIQEYQQKIGQQDAAAVSLQNESSLLDNHIQQKQLLIERTKQQINIITLHRQQLQATMAGQSQVLSQRLDILRSLLRRLQQADQVSPLDAFVLHPSFSEFFAHLEAIKQLAGQLLAVTQALKESRQQLAIEQQALEMNRLTLEKQQALAVSETETLAAERQAKRSLIVQTQNQESEFQRIITELRQEQQGAADQIAELQRRLKDRLDTADAALARGDILLSWPISALKGISAKFHDPNYPFRKFFEHPGVDLPTPVGTSVHAAAGGYVAWNRTGHQYGNYIMIVHSGGIATVYAHLSKFIAKPDSYVERGDVIGLSGGQPGDEGAGLSTGPHLHFEVRQNGIPVDPEGFLPTLDAQP